MASKDKINMPSGMAGLTRFNEEYHSKFVLSPNHVFVAIAVVALLLLILLSNGGYYGYKLLGLA